MRKLNISVAKNYTDKHNAIKTKWINIGSLVIGDDGKVFGEIESIPVGVTELKFNCFDREDKTQNNYQQQQQPTQNYQQQQQQPHHTDYQPQNMQQQQGAPVNDGTIPF